MFAQQGSFFPRWSIPASYMYIPPSWDTAQVPAKGLRCRVVGNCHCAKSWNCLCPTLLSVVLNTMARRKWGGKALFHLLFPGPSPWKIRQELQQQHWQKPLKKQLSGLLPGLCSASCLHSPGPRPREGTAHRGLGHATAISNQDASHTCLQASLIEEVLY